MSDYRKTIIFAVATLIFTILFFWTALTADWWPWWLWPYRGG